MRSRLRLYRSDSAERYSTSQLYYWQCRDTYMSIGGTVPFVSDSLAPVSLVCFRDRFELEDCLLPCDRVLRRVERKSPTRGTHRGQDAASHTENCPLALAQGRDFPAFNLEAPPFDHSRIGGALGPNYRGQLVERDFGRALSSHASPATDSGVRPLPCRCHPR